MRLRNCWQRTEPTPPLPNNPASHAGHAPKRVSAQGELGFSFPVASTQKHFRSEIRVNIGNYFPFNGPPEKKTRPISA